MTSTANQSNPSVPPLPKINSMLMGGFRVFNRRYLKKHFHTVAIHRAALSEATISEEDSLVVFANHASWWDPLIAIYLADTIFPKFRMYAPIDAEAFEKYRIFGHMGFYPVAQNQRKGAAHFLKTSRQVLEHSGASIWLTPEGRFADVRDDSSDLMPGLAHLAWSCQSGRMAGGDSVQPETGSDAMRRTAGRVWFIPVAVEYVFWEERLPEILVRFGSPLLARAQSEDGNQTPNSGATPAISHEANSKSAWNTRLTEGLRGTQRALAQDSISRRSDQFEIMLRSQSGTFFIYDWWRGLRSRLRGENFSSEHSQKLNESRSSSSQD